MKHILFIFFLIFAIFLLCHSCKREVAPTYSMLLTADTLMWSKSDSALLLLEQISDFKRLKEADCALYALLLTQARYKKFILLENDSLIRIAVDYYKDSKDRERLAKSYFYQGCVYAENNDLPKAIELFLKSLNEMPRGKDSIFVAMVYGQLGDCYDEQDLHSTARNMYKVGYSLCVEKDSVRACYILKDIGDTFILEYQLDSTLFYYQQALNTAISLQDSDLLFLIYQNISAVYNDQKKYAEAGIYISKALAQLTNKNDESYISACSTKGDILNNLEQNDSAIYYWSLGTFSSNIYVKTSSYDCLYQEYKKKKDWENATLYADSFMIYYDSIQTMNDRAELDRLMDNHLIEMHKQDLSIRSQRIVAGLIIIFLLLVFVLIVSFLWRDRIRKDKYLALQQRLMENRAEALLLNDISELTIEYKKDNILRLEEERFRICQSLFESTEGCKRLKELVATTPKVRITKVCVYRKVIVNDLRKIFANVMEDLKEHCTTLTNDDILYCVLSMLRYPKDVILDIMDASADAIKTRKNRIKNKMDADLFNKVFDIDL